MSLIRITITALITLAVVLLPASGNAILLPSPADMAMADHADMPCCPSCDNQGDFKATGCALNCAAFTSAVLPAMTVVGLPFITDRTLLMLAEDALRAHVSAPTHPPPI